MKTRREEERNMERRIQKERQRKRTRETFMGREEQMMKIEIVIERDAFRDKK